MRAIDYLVSSIVIIAILAVFVARNSRSADVFNAAGDAFSKMVKTIVAPITSPNG